MRDILLGGRRISDQQQRIMSRLRIIPGVEKRLFVGLPRVVHHPATGLADEQPQDRWQRSEEHTSELQSLMRISYAVFCLKKKTTTTHITPFYDIHFYLLL